MRRPLAVLAVAVALVSGTALTAAAGPPSGGSHAGRQAGPTSSSDWLGEINLYRAASGLAPVTSNVDWDQGITNHLTYLAKTDPALMTGQYASAHTENPASPYYTQTGAQEGGSSDLFMGAVGFTPVQYIDGWLAAPFHAIGMLRPDLTQVAFAYDPTTGDAGLDVISGLDQSQPPATAPTLFPGNGMTTYLDGYGGESPDPVESCSWPSTVQPGLPLIALLTTAPAQGLSATLTGPGGTMSTANGQLCAVDENTYRSSDPVYGPTGLQILQGDNAVLLIPRTPLTWGRYTADISQPGVAQDVSWSFIAAVPGQVQAGHAYELHVDSTGASTVLGNLTATNPDDVGFTTAYPCGTTPPLASNSNYTAGATVANFAAVHPDANGDICLFTRADSDLVWDQVGATNAITAGTPQRLLDTRQTNNRPAAGGTVTVHVGGAGTVFGNLTVVNPSGTGYATAYPCGGQPPLASNINYVAGQTVADFAAVAPDAQGDICIFTLQSADLIWDQVAQTTNITAATPQRLLDTRTTNNRPTAGGTVTVHVANAGAAQTVFGTLTAVDPSGVGFTTAYPCGQPLPLASNSNYVAGQTVATFAAVHPDSSGDICLYTYASADLVWDQVAQTSNVTAGTPVRLLDTRTETSHLN